MSDHDHDDHPCPDCAESPEAHEEAVVDRRAFLRRSVGSLLAVALGGPLLTIVSGGRMSGLSAVFANPDGSEPPLPGDPRIKSIVVLWMNGGPSQLDTFDPKPDSRNGGTFKAIDTAIKGVRVGEHLPRLAEMMDRMALVRCMQTGEGNHSRARTLMRTGFKPNPTVQYPGLGAIMSLERGDPKSPLPANIAIDGAGEPAGILGLSYDPLFVQRPGKAIENQKLAPGVTDARIDRRIATMRMQDAAFRARIGGRGYEVDGHEATMAKAVDFMRAEETRAFSIDDEPETTKQAYGTTDFGKGCLVARRLVEAGVRFVEVSLSGWDTHENNFERVAKLSSEVDLGMSALLRDLEERKLLDSTLVVWMGEFGRTPRINPREGRDHFAKAWSVALAGGGIKKGVVVGETDKDGENVVGNHVATADLFRTILWSAGIDPDYEYYSPQGRPVKYADGGRLITGLLQV